MTNAAQLRSRRCRRFAACVVGLMTLLTVALLFRTLQNFTVSGSAEHSNAWGAMLTGCPRDEGEAVADHAGEPGGVPVVGVQHRCRSR